MLDYDSAKKLYLVKCVQLTTLLPEWKKERFSRLNTPIPEHSGRLQSAGVPSKKLVSEHSASSSTKHSVSKSSISDVVESDSSSSTDGGVNVNKLKRPKSGLKSRPAKKPKSMRNSEYWVPRVRLLFAAEDPCVFADRVAYAHKSRCVCIYVCMCVYMCVHVCV